MCQEFLKQIDQTASKSFKINSGILSVPFGSVCNESHLFEKYNIKYYFGAKNNIPDDNSHATTLKILDLVKFANENAEKYKKFSPLLIAFISGGGSALLTCPKPGLSLEEKISISNELVRNGASINELNKVRSCLSSVKNGKLARFIIEKGIESVTLMISDVIGDPVDVIASGPMVIQSNKRKQSDDVIKIFEKYNLKFDPKVYNFIFEDDQLKFYQTKNYFIIGNNTIALNTAKEVAFNLGYFVISLGNEIQGEANKIGKKWAKMGMQFEFPEKKNYKGILWLAGGETTVNMKEKSCGKFNNLFQIYSNQL